MSLMDAVAPAAEAAVAQGGVDWTTLIVALLGIVSTATVAIVNLRGQRSRDTLQRREAVFLDTLEGLQELDAMSETVWLAFQPLDTTGMTPDQQVGALEAQAQKLQELLGVVLDKTNRCRRDRDRLALVSGNLAVLNAISVVLQRMGAAIDNLDAAQKMPDRVPLVDVVLAMREDLGHKLPKA